MLPVHEKGSESGEVSLASVPPSADPPADQTSQQVTRAPLELPKYACSLPFAPKYISGVAVTIVKPELARRARKGKSQEGTFFRSEDYAAAKAKGAMLPIRPQISELFHLAQLRIYFAKCLKVQISSNSSRSGSFSMFRMMSLVRSI